MATNVNSVTDVVTPNIFKPRSDWNVKSFKCRKYTTDIDFFEKLVAREIRSVFGVDIYETPNYRNRELVDARRVYMTLMSKHTKRSQASIGRSIGKDHSTVIHAIRSTQNLCETDKQFKKMYEFIDQRIKQLN